MIIQKKIPHNISQTGPQILDLLYSILIIGSLGSRENNALLNLNFQQIKINRSV